jgi:hypothetical protein
MMMATRKPKMRDLARQTMLDGVRVYHEAVRIEYVRFAKPAYHGGTWMLYDCGSPIHNYRSFAKAHNAALDLVRLHRQ